MKSKRCDCVKSEDLRKAIGSLKKLSANFEKAFKKSCLNYSIGCDCIFDPALIPFDMVANGAKVCVGEDPDYVDLSGSWEKVKIGKCDKGSIGGFANAWTDALENAFCGLDVQLFVEVYSAFGRVMNGFCNENVGRGVFVSDYGYFRGMLSRCLILSFNKNTGGLSECERIGKVEADVFSRRRLDVRTCRRLKSLELGADCGSPEKLAKAAQIDCAVRRYKARWKIDSVRQILEYVIGFPVLKFNGKNVSTESGYRDWKKLRPEFRRAIISEGISLKKNNRERKRLKVERERKMRKSKMRFV